MGSRIKCNFSGGKVLCIKQNIMRNILCLQILIFLFLCFSNTVVYSQTTRYYPAEEFKPTLIEKKVGAMIIYNGTKHSFTLDIADTIKSGGKPYLLTVNKKVLKVNVTQFQHRFNFDSLETSFLKQNLLGTMNYLKIRDHNSKDLDKNYEFIVLNGQIFLFWEGKAPVSSKTIDKQYYLETICFDEIVVMYTPVMKGGQSDSTAVYDSNRAFLLSIGSTLKLNNYPLNVNELSREFKKEELADEPARKTSSKQ
jgi:hypothetical protein